MANVKSSDSDMRMARIRSCVVSGWGSEDNRGRLYDAFAGGDVVGGVRVLRECCVSAAVQSGMREKCLGRQSPGRRNANLSLDSKRNARQYR